MSNDQTAIPSGGILVQSRPSTFLCGKHSIFSKKPSIGNLSGQNLLSEMSSSVIGTHSNQLLKSISDLKIPPSPAAFPFVAEKTSLEESLFDATSTVKILASQVAMHMEKAWRDKLFNQIDSLHILDEWDSDDKPIRKSSFASFLKSILQIKPQRHPSLGLTFEGYLIAAWTINQDRFIAEYLPNDRVKWVLTRIIDGEIERASGQTAISRLLDCLIPYQPEHWFSNEQG